VYESTRIVSIECGKIRSFVSRSESCHYKVSWFWSRRCVTILSIF